MFDPSCPPLLVLLMKPDQVASFPESDGYIHHPISESQVALCYREGWTFPVTPDRMKLITGRPLMLVRDRGGVTSEGSTFLKGYANQFVNDCGGTPGFEEKLAIFNEGPQDEWMLVPCNVNVIWLQYGYKYQFLGGSGHERQEFHYGKLMIRELTVVEDYAPRFDRKADIAAMHSKQFRVHDHQLLDTSWNRADGGTLQQIQELLLSRGLNVYLKAVEAALMRAGLKV